MIERSIEATELAARRVDPDHFVNVLAYSSAEVERVAWDATGDRIVVRFQGRGAELDELIATVGQRLADSADRWPPRVLFARTGEERLTRAEVHERLEREGWLREIEPGRVAYRGELANLIEHLDHALESIALRLGAERLHLPAMVPVAVLERCGAFDQYPHSLFFAAPLSRGIDSIQTYQGADDRATGDCIHRHQQPPLHGLKTSACCLVYPLLEGAQLERPQLFSVSALCSRQESKAARGLERLAEFRMREIVFVGERAGAEAFDATCRRLLSELFRCLDLNGEIATASDPFFVSNFAPYRQAQLLGDDKLEARLPPVGAQGGLAFASLNRHRGFFARRFDISCRGEGAASACFGVGLERLALGLLCRHGMRWRELEGRLEAFSQLSSDQLSSDQLSSGQLSSDQCPIDWWSSDGRRAEP